MPYVHVLQRLGSLRAPHIEPNKDSGDSVQHRKDTEQLEVLAGDLVCVLGNGHGECAGKAEVDGAGERHADFAVDLGEHFGRVHERDDLCNVSLALPHLVWRL